MQQVEEVQRAAARLQVLVAIEAAAQLVAQQRREVRVGIALEDVELEHQLLQRLVSVAARVSPLAKLAVVPCARGGSRDPVDKSISSASAPSRSPASISIGSSSLARRDRRRVEIQRIARLAASP